MVFRSMDGLGYLAWHAEADRRHKAGQRQRYCHTHRVWEWPDEHGTDCRLVKHRMCIRCEKAKQAKDEVMCRACVAVTDKEHS